MAEVLNYYKIGCCIPEGSVYIGRGNKSKGLPHSKYANPFKLTEEEPRGSTIERYRGYLWNEIKEGRITIEELKELHGLNLVCFCSPQSCHGDILLKAIEWATEEKYA